MGVGESVYYHCTSREGGYAMHTHSSPTAHTCRHHVAPLQLPLPWFLSSLPYIVLYIDARLVYCSWPQQPCSPVSVCRLLSWWRGDWWVKTRSDIFSTPSLTGILLPTQRTTFITHCRSKYRLGSLYSLKPARSSPTRPHTLQFIGAPAELISASCVLHDRESPLQENGTAKEVSWSPAAPLGFLGLRDQASPPVRPSIPKFFREEHKLLMRT